MRLPYPYQSMVDYYQKDIWKNMHLIGKDNDGTLYSLTWRVHAGEGDAADGFVQPDGIAPERHPPVSRINGGRRGNPINGV